MIDLTPPRGTAAGCGGQHLEDLGPAFHRDGIDPSFADPVRKAMIGKLALRHGHIKNPAVRRQDESDIANGGQQRRGNGGWKRSGHDVRLRKTRFTGGGDMLVH